ncbi:type II toxin-antitoxin system HipA family toxin [Bradyrhizobium sp. 48]|uniref:type II toxin-antitoxin system HipA family toxin n=1 Tax=Bradyrhizobium sp. 48 TaxID=2782676 RepID=UPI001FFB456B|nr:HipA domain-containing protein [Bradyrhizobium sp. 48]MCK1441899.1 type II toxin-antitoxin system HipA family toxin [Bradyrhizobium sp. 48]
MKLMVQAYFGGRWHDAAVVTLAEPDKGLASASSAGYEMDYWYQHGTQKDQVRDLRAYSVEAPVDLEDRTADTWPAFLLDLLPQGRQADRIAAFLGIKAGDRAAQIQLLLRSASAPVGNLRIREAHEEESKRIGGMARIGVTMDDILARTDQFLAMTDDFALIASGSSGLQGDWPKVALTKSKADGSWYPDPMVADADAEDHVIAKLLRSDEGVDQRILQSEAGYAKVAQNFGLLVERPATYGNGVLVIPRFDRGRNAAGGLVRYGQESLVSAIGVAAFGHLEKHETYVAKIQDVSSDPLADTIEYLRRDMLNLAMGNPDNHGRNTALRKLLDGQVRLSPLFDFAPMRISLAGYVRSTKWACMSAAGGSDIEPDWRVICEAVSRPDVPAEDLMAALAEKEDLLRALPDAARKHGVPDTVISSAVVRGDDMADKVAKLRSAPTYG